MRFGLVSLGVAFIGALGLPVLADSSPSVTPEPKVAQLQRRVSLLEKNLAGLRRIALANANESLRLEARVANLENQPAPQSRITLSPLASTLVLSQSSSTVTALCASGKPVSGGFFSLYPIELKASVRTPSGWQVTAFNPFAQVNTVNVYAICLG